MKTLKNRKKTSQYIGGYMTTKLSSIWPQKNIYFKFLSPKMTAT
jgi:hypothetical protein